MKDQEHIFCPWFFLNKEVCDFVLFCLIFNNRGKDVPKIKEKIMLVKKYAKDWLSNKKINLKVRSYELYEYYFDKLILPYFNKYQVEDVSTEKIQNFILFLINKHSTSTIISCYKVLKSFLQDYYEEQEIVPKVKFKKIKLPLFLEKKVGCFSQIEQRKIEKRLNIERKPNRIGILLSLYLGLRLGETLALTWDNVDFAKSVIYVEKTVFYKDKKLIYTTPKTKCSTRTIPIPTPILLALKKVKQKNKSLFVVASRSGKPYIPRTYQYEYKVFLKRCGIDYRNYHSLRHTFATRSVECGMDIKSLSEIMGHANSIITLSKYTHSMIEHKRQMLNKMALKMKSNNAFMTEARKLFSFNKNFQQN